MTNPNDPAFPLVFNDKEDGFKPFLVENSGLSAREHVAIKLCVPNSGAPWLDDMIRQAQRQQFAKAALSLAILVREGYIMDTEPTASELAKAAVTLGDALIKELDKI